MACVALASGCGDPSTGSPDAGTEDAAVVRDDGGRLDAGAHDDAGGTDAAAVPAGGPLECEAGYAPVDGECVDVDEYTLSNYRLTLARFLHRPTTICAPTGP